MKENTRVTWLTVSGAIREGITIANETKGYVLVAMDDLYGFICPVLYCEVAKLTIVSEK